MKRSIEIAEIPLMDPFGRAGQEWESLVCENQHSGFMQSLHWAQFKQACQQTVIQLTVRQEGRLIAGCLLYTFPDERKPTMLAAPYGPVLPWENSELAAECLKLLMAKAEEIARRLNAVTWRIEPRLAHPAPRILHEFGEGAVNHLPAETLYLDLKLDPEIILARMKHKCRYNIALSQKRGVIVREETGADAAATLYSLLTSASERDDFFLEPLAFFKTLLDSLIPTGMLKLLLAEHEGDTLGALVLVMHGRQATYLYGGISNLKRHLMAGYALQWAAIRKAQLAGCSSYDFYGYDQFLAPSHAYARFSRFKSGFAGTPMRFIGARDYMFMDKLVDNIIGFFQDVSCDKTSNEKELYVKRC